MRPTRTRLKFFRGRPFITYTTPDLAKAIDIVIVDGPPAATRRGREACLYYAYDRLRVGGTVILDDLCRQDEQTILANWFSVYPSSFEVSRWDGGHGLAQLTKVTPRKMIWTATTFRDSWVVNGQRAKQILKDKVKQHIGKV